MTSAGRRPASCRPTVISRDTHTTSPVERSGTLNAIPRGGLGRSRLDRLSECNEPGLAIAQLGKMGQMLSQCAVRG